MYFSTFVLVMIVTVGVIAFGASLVARALNVIVRSMFKARPVRVVSPLASASGSLNGEWLKAAGKSVKSTHHGYIEAEPLEGEIVSEPSFIALNPIKLIGGK